MADIDRLLDALLPAARRSLDAGGTLVTFGACVAADGGIARVEADASASDAGRRGAVIDRLRLKVSDGAQSAALCAGVRVVPPGTTSETDAVRVTVEHPMRGAVDVFVPYRRGLFGKVRFGDRFATPGRPQIFVTSERA